GRDDHLDLTVEDLVLGTDDVTSNGGHAFSLRSFDWSRESETGNREPEEPRLAASRFSLLTIPHSLFPIPGRWVQPLKRLRPSSSPSRTPRRCRRPCRTPAPAGGRIRRRRSSGSRGWFPSASRTCPASR